MRLGALVAAAAAGPGFPPGTAVVLTGPAPAVPPERLLGARVAGPRTLFAPPAREKDRPWATASIGEALRIEASGPERFAALRDAAAAAFARVRVVESRGAADAPPPAFLGGLAFTPGESREPPWAGFGEAWFRLPRWSLHVQEGGLAFLRLVLDAAELARPTRALTELAAIEQTLAAAPPAPAAAPGRLEDSDREAWARLHGAAMGAIASERLAKVVLARRLRLVAPRPIDPRAILAAPPEPGTLRFLLESGETTFAGRTPERLLVLAGKRLRSDALAGSIPRRGDDEAEARALLASDKDAREHRHVVEGIRAALAPFASVSTDRRPSVRTLRTVHHLHTKVEGKLKAPAHLLDLAAALHPTAAVSGTPKAAALAFLAGHEGLDRGWYAGPVGRFDAAGDGELWVALRSAALRGNEAWVYAGGGVVAGSVADAEWRETAAKAASIVEALGGTA